MVASGQAYVFKHDSEQVGRGSFCISHASDDPNSTIEGMTEWTRAGGPKDLFAKLTPRKCRM